MEKLTPREEGIRLALIQMLLGLMEGYAHSPGPVFELHLLLADDGRAREFCEEAEACFAGEQGPIAKKLGILNDPRVGGTLRIVRGSPQADGTVIVSIHVDDSALVAEGGA